MNQNNKPTFLLSASGCSSECQHRNLTPPSTDSAQGCSFQVEWSINPHMKVGAVQKAKAHAQHAQFAQTLRDAGAQVMTVPFVHGAYDSVFIKDNAVIKQGTDGVTALVTRPFYKEREVESEQRRFTLKKCGIQVVGQARHHLEGGDVVVAPTLQKVFMGYGFRTDPKAAAELAHFFDAEVITLELKNPNFYHLDVALSILADGTAFACREAFTDEAWKKLKNSGIRALIPVTKKDAMSFGLNWVEVGNTIVMGSFLPGLMEVLMSVGKQVRYAPLDQFQLAGGSAACLVSEIHDFEPTHYREAPARASRYGTEMVWGS